MFRSLGKLMLGAGFALAISASVNGAVAEQLHTIHAFKKDAKGLAPREGVVQDMAGNLYGTTSGGGANNFGAVFKIAPNGTETVLYSFKGRSDGFFPVGKLRLDTAGNLYGTTYRGGNQKCFYDGCGTVFKLAPDGTETILHRFAGSLIDGGNPWDAGLIIDKAGNHYGTTSYGGSGGCYRNDGCCYQGAGCGVIFKLAPDGTETILHVFGNGSDGANPSSDLLADKAGNLYGMTNDGGAYGYGTIFKLASNGAETILHSFSGRDNGGDGSNPSGGLIIDKAGNLYGTTSSGGTNGPGTVFKLAPDGTETVLHSFNFFSGAVDGRNPGGGLVADKEGNLYGTTMYGGNTGCFSNEGCGTIFKITPQGTEQILWRFTGDDGAQPNPSLIMDDAGFLYGTTVGWNSNGGTVFKIKK